MSKSDYLNLNGRTLRLFITVYEEKSVTKAAQRLNIGQSAVSHMLDKLRKITGDSLFVRSGRGIVATKRAEQLEKQVRPILASLQQLSIEQQFDPGKLQDVVTIGAAAIQRELLLPRFAQILRKEAPDLDLKVINSGVFSADLLRKDGCDLLITPAPPDGTEFLQQKLFASQWICFYDPSTPPPLTLDQYVARPHAKVVFTDDERSEIDLILTDMNLTRRAALRVSSFSALPQLMRGTELIVTLPKFIEQTFMREFSSCPLLFDLPPLPFFMAWHIGKNRSPYHRWLRANLKKVVSELNL